MKRATVALAILLLAAGAGAASAEVSARDAFAALAGLAGTWQGVPEGSGEAAAPAEEAGGVTHEIVLSAAGTVVMETMQPGTDHEMINMYHLDGDDLVLTHYCAGGNQPTMRLDRQASTAELLVFDFTGGTNLDPATDEHIHDMEIELMGDGQMESRWTGWSGGEAAGVMTFRLARAE
jgi:hypothetical protein